MKMQTTRGEIHDYDRQLDGALRRIRESSKLPSKNREFHPLKIILFGSYAYGNPGPDSDVVLLVVMPLVGTPVDKSVEMRLKLQPCFPLDLLVRTPAKIRERLAMGDDFIKDIFDKGKVLYEAPNR